MQNSVSQLLSESNVVSLLVVSERGDFESRYADILDGSRYHISQQVEHIQALSDVRYDQQQMMLVMDVYHCDCDQLQLLSHISEQALMPVAVFADTADDSAVEQSVEAGISALIIGGIEHTRMLSILKLAEARFQKAQRMKQEIHELKTALADRKVIDRAKGLVMDQRRCSENEAYAMMRTTAMNKNIKLATLAQEILTSAQATVSHSH
jgi:response regulator NasT